MMKRYLFILASLAFVALSIPADAANRWAVCNTACASGNTSTAMWSSVGSGGATGASAPTSADAVIIDGGTCVGGTTCTITTFAGTISAQTITWGACTASTTGCIIDASVNNTSFTLGGSSGYTFSGTGTGTRKWLAGTGTYALTHAGANGCFTMATTTSDQGSVFSGATWSCSGATTSTRTWAGGGFTFGPTTFNGNSSNGSTFISGANTFSSLTINSPAWLSIGANQTITNALTATGSSSSSMVTMIGIGVDTPATISLGAASTATWLVLRSITTSGAAALNATNCTDLGRNTLANSGTCSAPAPTGGAHIIGGG